MKKIQRYLPFLLLLTAIVVYSTLTGTFEGASLVLITSVIIALKMLLDYISTGFILNTLDIDGLLSGKDKMLSPMESQSLSNVLIAQYWQNAVIISSVLIGIGFLNFQ